MGIIQKIKNMVKRPPRPKLGQVLAATGDGRDITKPFTGALERPEDSVLATRGSGDLKIYEQVLSDEEVKSAFTQRQDAVISREIRVEAGGESPLDIAAADAMRNQIEALGFDRITRLMHYGVFYGYAVAELIYSVRDSLLWVDEVKVRNRRRFRFAPGGGLRLLTRSNMHTGEPCPPPYFWTFCTGADHDDEPYGLGLAHWLYWPTLFKRNDIKFWLIFLDKFGMPTALGRYEEGATDDQKKELLQLIQAIQTDSGIVMPRGLDIELLAAGRSGAADYESMYNAMNNAIRRVIVGQTASSGGTPGKLGNEQLQADVLLSIAKSDADVICESWNRGPGAWLTEFNFPGAAVPRVYRVFEDAEDLSDRAKRDKAISETTGFRPTLATVQETYGGEWEPAPRPDNPAPASTPPVELAEHTHTPDAARLMSGQLNDTLQPALTAWITQIETLVQNAATLEDIRDGLDALAPALTLDQYAAAMAQALTAAELAGRFDIVEAASGR